MLSKIKFAIFALAIFCLWSAAADGDNAKTPDIVASTDTAYAKFDNAKAYELHKKTYAADNSDFHALAMLTASCCNLGEEAKDAKTAEKRLTEALGYAEKLVAKYPDNAEAHCRLAIVAGRLCLLKSGSEKIKISRKVYKHAKEAIKLDRTLSKAHVTLGMYYREVAMLGWSMKLLAKTLGGGLPDATIEMSEKELRTAVELAPNVIYPNYQLALTLEAEGKKAEAAKLYQKVLDLPITDHQDAEKKKDAAAKVKALK